MPTVAVPSQWEDPAAQAAGAKGGRHLTPKVVLRAMRRHWWHILLIWGVGSVAAVMLIQAKVKPTYEATAYVQIDPPSNTSIIGNSSLSNNVEGQLETQAHRMLTNDVLGVAIAEPAVARLPRIQLALDAQAELRREVRVQVIRGTRYISVSMSAPTSREGVTIVNAIAKAYEKSVADMAAGDVSKQTSRLTKFLETLQGQFDSKKNDLRDIIKRADGRLARSPTSTRTPGARARTRWTRPSRISPSRCKTSAIGPTSSPMSSWSCWRPSRSWTA